MQTKLDPAFSTLASLEGLMTVAIRVCNDANAKWNVDPATGKTIIPNVGEQLMLMVSELSEGMEGHRKRLQDDKCPQFDMLTVELADTIIRIFHFAGRMNLPLAAAFRAKMEYNATRADHTHEARLQPHGKQY